MDCAPLKKLLLNQDPEFWGLLTTFTRQATDFEELFQLVSLRKKAEARSLSNPGLISEKISFALIGGYSLYPLHELIEHLALSEGIPVELWKGDYDNYISEIMDEMSGLYSFNPHVVMVMPSENRCKYPGLLTDPRAVQQAEAQRAVDSLLDLASKIHLKTRAEILLTNFMLPAHHDLGAFRSRTLGSDWSFRKWVNLELGLAAPSYVHVCDLAFLANRHGGIKARDARSWFESKQPCSSSLLVELAREVVHLLISLRRAPKKVLVLDLDNTLWGGVVADDGLEGIELGDTSARGEAFKAFQKEILSLKQRGVLLAICSKNYLSKAQEPFLQHPEMVLRLEDFASFKANWEPKSENIRQMAAELNLGLDSFVFVDDNPAEIEIVRQFVPDVATLLLGPDPSDYRAALQDCRLFEPRNITAEDLERTGQYQAESQRKALVTSLTDMGAYLESLEMEAGINEFVTVDVPRLSQLINKSNQFNLTTRRRSETEVLDVMNDPLRIGFSVRLKDRFGDHGLISIVIAEQLGEILRVDTWLMSCRVLKRQVEEVVLNELVRLAKLRGCNRLLGVYFPTAKNEMVRDFYSQIGFTLTVETESQREFELQLENFQPILTKIKIIRRAYESS